MKFLCVHLIQILEELLLLLNQLISHVLLAQVDLFRSLFGMESDEGMRVSFTLCS